MEPTSNIIIPAIVSAVVALTTVFFKDKMKFNVERLKENTEYHRKLVESWHVMLSKELEDQDGWNLYHSTEYISLRPYLSRDALSQLEPTKNRTRQVIRISQNYRDGVAGDDNLSLIQDEIKRIQKKWKIF